MPSSPYKKSTFPVVQLVKWPRGLRVFQKDIDQAPKGLEIGDQVEVLDRAGNSCGFGVWHPSSMIAVRILRTDAPFDDDWIRGCALAAINRRRAANVNLNEPCRIIHAESDDLPALIVDRFDDTLCAELYSETAVHLWDTISPILHKELGTQHHLLRFDEKSARAENAQPLELRSNSCPNLLKISENGIRYEVDLRDGHKTGFFCDQRLNRQKIRAEVERVIATKGHCSVLDICTYTGGFALAAAVGGATEVQGVDLDEKAIAVAKRNANLNQTTKVRFTHSDAFPWLRQAFENGSRFDIVIVDPPKFIPNRSKWDEGIAKYHDLNKVAAPLLEEGGLMLTCSCSGLLPMSDFQEKVRQATKRLGRPLRIEAATGAGPDHPVRLDFPEGAYLKALWLRG
ncbi:MAG TPA: class I SAM-dependent rRNA methyltransferase [Planctomycetota bacterium]|jgi:23S rRNA (cytosine1962-C5)-methyltransferase|nr:hypothetical protein [Planctomycetota bacterium]MDP6128832.1 class I SAM-dependent rRNA methyltransferase [Planctomycetota bacterium]HJM38598.1 class I SAM-dependent rRNA methyltransferase [Planctomycetota bacterium]|tara:strand:- start:3641 stop:4837 length:1197 start_codon:yes stop_codon:yes gene_type:complete